MAGRLWRASGEWSDDDASDWREAILDPSRWNIGGAAAGSFARVDGELVASWDGSAAGVWDNATETGAIAIYRRPLALGVSNGSHQVALRLDADEADADGIILGLGLINAAEYDGSQAWAARLHKRVASGSMDALDHSFALDFTQASGTPHKGGIRLSGNGLFVTEVADSPKASATPSNEASRFRNWLQWNTWGDLYLAVLLGGASGTAGSVAISKVRYDVRRTSP